MHQSFYTQKIVPLSARKEEELWIKNYNTHQQGVSKLLNSLQHSSHPKDKQDTQQLNNEKSFQLPNMPFSVHNGDHSRSSIDIKSQNSKSIHIVAEQGQSYKQASENSGSQSNHQQNSSSASNGKKPYCIKQQWSQDSDVQQKNGIKGVLKSKDNKGNVMTIGERNDAVLVIKRKGRTPKHKTREQKIQILKDSFFKNARQSKNQIQAMQKQINLMFRREIQNKKQQKILIPRQHQQIFKRIFIKKLLKYLETIKAPDRPKTILKFSTLLGVFKYQMNIWLGAYPIVFVVEQEDDLSVKHFQTHLTAEQKIQIVKNQLLSYMNTYPQVKDYMLKKILSRVFNLLDLCQNRTSEWYKKFLAQNHDKLPNFRITYKKDIANESENDLQQSNQPSQIVISSSNSQNHQILNTPQQISQKNNIKQNKEKKIRKKRVSKKLQNKKANQKNGKKKRKLNQYDNNQQTQPFIIQKNGIDSQSYLEIPQNKKKVIQVKRQQIQQQELNSDINVFPQFFQKSIAEKLDKAFSNCINSIVEEKAQVFCMNKQSIMQIYRKFGKTSFQSKLDGFICKEQNVIKQENEVISLEQESQNSELRKDSESENELVHQDDSSDTSKEETSEKIGKQNNQAQIQDNQQVDKENLQEKKAKKSKKVQKDKPELYNALQLKLVKYVDKHPECDAPSLQGVTNKAMTKLGFTLKMKNKVRSQWFAYFLRKYDVKIPDDRKASSEESNQ